MFYAGTTWLNILACTVHMHADFSVTGMPFPSLSLCRLYFSGELAQQRDVKFIFRGQVIEDVSTTLQQLGVTNNSAIHVHISQPRPQAAEQEPANQTDENEILDLSNLFVPLFGVILGIVWVSFFMWPNVFSLLTKLSLFALSLGYVVLTYATSFT